MKKLKYWNLMKNEEEKTAELILYGTIGSDEVWDDISDKAFKQDIENLGDVEKIILHINSPGGSVYSAVAIANTLKNHKATVEAYIDGLCASAATIITSACDVVKMPKNALFMIHNPLTAIYGNANEMQKTADLLGKVKENIIETYLGKVKIDKVELSKLMDNETWLNAEEAKEKGFIDEILNKEVEREEIKNKLIFNNLAFDISNFKNFNIKKEEEEMDITKLKNEYPAIYEEILNEGKKLGIEAGILNERERIKNIDKLDSYGVEDLVNKAKYEEPLEAGQLAINILEAQKIARKEKHNNLKNESQKNITTPMPNNGTLINNEEPKSFMGVKVENILKAMNKGGK